MKPFALAAVLLFATAALLFGRPSTAGELCVGYFQETHGWDSDKYAPRYTLMSFNPRTRKSFVVAKIDDFPHGAWEKGFTALIHEAVYWLEWKVGVVPTLLPRPLGTSWDTPTPHDGEPAPTFDAPAHRRIRANHGGDSDIDGFSTPVVWVDTETGEEKTLSDEPFGGTDPALRISTADNFILIAEESGNRTVVADMNSGEVLFRAGTFSYSPRWVECSSVGH